MQWLVITLKFLFFGHQFLKVILKLLIPESGGQYKLRFDTFLRAYAPHCRNKDLSILSI